MKLWWPGNYDSSGFKQMRLELINGEKRVDAMNVYSGGASRQKEAFVHPTKDWPKSVRPIHEGVFNIGPVERGNWGPGIGSIWISLDAQSGYRPNKRSAFGFHDDHNRTTARGSLGCVVFYKRSELLRVVKWVESYAKPVELVVDWGTGYLKERGYEYFKFDRTEEKPDPAVVDPNIRPSRLSERGAELIHHFEGLHKLLPNGMVQSYWDALGRVWTIGWGHTKTAKKDMVVTRAEAEALFFEDMRFFENKTRYLVTADVNQHEFDALCSFCFNLGHGALSRSTLLKRVNEGRREEAANEFLKWNKAGSPLRAVAGLTRRRKAERHLFLTGQIKTEF